MAIDPHRLSGLADEASPLLEKQLEAHKQLRWQQIELRTINNSFIDKIDLNEIEKINEKIISNNLCVNVIASTIGNWNSDISCTIKDEILLLKKYIKRMRMFGAKYLRIMSYNNRSLTDHEWGDEVKKRFLYFTEIACKENIILLHENCTGWASKSTENSLELMETVNSNNLGLLFDIGNGVAYGYSSIQFLKDVLPWVQHIHIKDAYLNNGQVIYCLPGKGQADLSDCLRLLLDNNYHGNFAIEPHTNLIIHQHHHPLTKDQTLFNSYITYGKSFMSLYESLVNKSHQKETLC